MGTTNISSQGSDSCLAGSRKELIGKKALLFNSCSFITQS